MEYLSGVTNEVLDVISLVGTFSNGRNADCFMSEPSDSTEWSVGGGTWWEGGTGSGVTLGAGGVAETGVVGAFHAAFFSARLLLSVGLIRMDFDGLVRGDRIESDPVV